MILDDCHHYLVTTIACHYQCLLKSQDSEVTITEVSHYQQALLRIPGTLLKVQCHECIYVLEHVPLCLVSHLSTGLL